MEENKGNAEIEQTDEMKVLVVEQGNPEEENDER